MNILRLINTVLGVGLIYAALLAPWIVATEKWFWIDLLTGIVVLFLSLLGRRHHIGTWQSDAVSVLAIVLIVHSLARFVVGMPLVLNTWLVFWVGLSVSVLSLWAVLYRGPIAEEKP